MGPRPVPETARAAGNGNNDNDNNNNNANNANNNANINSSNDNSNNNVNNHNINNSHNNNDNDNNGNNDNNHNNNNNNNRVPAGPGEDRARPSREPRTLWRKTAVFLPEMSMESLDKSSHSRSPEVLGTSLTCFCSKSRQWNLKYEHLKYENGRTACSARPLITAKRRLLIGALALDQWLPAGTRVQVQLCCFAHAHACKGQNN